MITRKILPSKRPIDIHFPSVDFSQLFAPGDNLASVVPTISVQTGVDPIPEVMLGNTLIAGNVVSQELKEGVYGVVYIIRLTGTSVSGDVRIFEYLLAITPRELDAAFRYYSNYLTSRPYAVFMFDSARYGLTPLAGELANFAP